MPSALSSLKASDILVPLKPVLIEKKKASPAVPAWPFLGISLVLLSAAAFVVKKWLAFLIPPCNLHRMTGLPCPTCGFTRMVFYLLELDLESAFLVQPFLFAAVLFFFLWIVAGLAAYLSGRLLFLEVSPFWRRYAWIPLLLAFVLNWLYLFRTGV